MPSYTAFLIHPFEEIHFTSIMISFKSFHYDNYCDVSMYVFQSFDSRIHTLRPKLKDNTKSFCAPGQGKGNHEQRPCTYGLMLHKTY